VTFPRWATKEEAAQHVGVHPRTIVRWVEEGRLRAYRAGPRLLRFNLNDLDDMLGVKAAD
jgi:excisionase family DNA binding protein